MSEPSYLCQPESSKNTVPSTYLLKETKKRKNKRRQRRMKEIVESLICVKILCPRKNDLIVRSGGVHLKFETELWQTG
jgi:hypothetical protein